MRVTAKTKAETRERVLAAAATLFQERGYDETTTRDIAAAAEVAAGTIFNYFPTKEALAITLVAESLAGVDGELGDRLDGIDTLEEALFCHVAIEQRRLRAHRRYVRNALESTLRPPAGTVGPDAGRRLRDGHLQIVCDLIAAYSSRPAEPLSVVTLHLYWTLYLAVMIFWSDDESPHQEDSLALLDQTLRLFAASVKPDNGASWKVETAVPRNSDRAAEVEHGS